MAMEIGTTTKRTITVTPEQLACNVGSGSVEVFTAAAAAFLGRSVEGRVRQAPVMEV